MQNTLTSIIQSSLPLSVHDYMQLCLQHPEYGYYRRAPAVGAAGDFTTAPEISQIFGDLLGMWWQDVAAQLGRPADYVELGPGRGTLAADILRFCQPASLHLVESNETLRAHQAARLRGAHPQWHDDIRTLPPQSPLLIMANEFFDALPIRQWVGDQERQVVKDENGELAFSPQGAVTRESCPQGEAIMAALCQRLKRQGGVLLMIDYGYEINASPQGEERQADTLQAVKHHAYHSPLQSPGEADLTAHVDFTALKQVAQGEGCQVSPVVEQGSFLQRLGGEIWLQKLMLKQPDLAKQRELQEGWIRLTSPSQMGSLFKVMAIAAPEPKLQLSGF